MIAQLSRRDRIALIVGALAVLGALLFLGVIEPYQNAMERLDARIAARGGQVTEVQGMKQEYLRLQRQSAAAEQLLAKGSAFSLFSFVETATGQVAGKENLIYMRPQPVASQADVREESVEIRLEKIRLDQLIRLLHAIDAADALLQVKNLRIKTRFDDKSLLDAVLTIASYGRAA